MWRKASITINTDLGTIKKDTNMLKVTQRDKLKEMEHVYHAINNTQTPPPITIPSSFNMSGQYPINILH